MMKENICYAILFFAEAIIAWLYCDYLFPKKNNFVRISIFFFLGYSVLFAVSRLNITAANAISFCIVNYLLIVYNYICTRKTALLHAAFLSFAMSIAEILVALLISCFGFGFAEYTNNFSVMVTLMIISKLLYFAFSIIATRFFLPKKHLNEEPRLMTLVFSLPLLSTGLSVFIVYIGSSAETNPYVEQMIVVTALALLFVNLIILVLYNHLQNVSAEYIALQLRIQKEEADTAYYQALQEQSEDQRILIHDIKNHLRTIDALASERKVLEIREYLSRLETSLEPIKNAKICNNPILNLILLRFSEDCQQKHISLQCDIRDNCVSFMDAPSITSLYGNLLSNAVDAANQSSERIVELSVMRNIEQAIIIISVVNSCDLPPIPDTRGRFLTSKRTPGIHGVGLKSIERIVAKHHGASTMYYDPECKRFHHIIQFPEQVN